MAVQNEQITSIGNGPSGMDPEPVAGPMAEPLKPSRPNTDPGSGNTTSGDEPGESLIISDSLSSLNTSPKSIVEALGLLQTRLFELRALKLKLRIEGSSGGKLYIVLSWPSHELGYLESGHITADKIPVLDIKEEE